MALNAQLLTNYLRPTSFFEDLALPDTSGRYRSMDPYHFFENNLMREILGDSNDSDEQELTFARSAVARPRLPYAKFAAASHDEATRFTATRPNSHDVSDNDEQTPQVPAPVVELKPRRPPGNLTVVVNRPVANYTTSHQRTHNRRKVTLKRHMDRVFETLYNEQNEHCMLSCRIRSLNSSNLVEFILEP